MMVTTSLKKVFDDGEDIIEKVVDDGEDIFEKVFDDGEDIFEEVFYDGEDIFLFEIFVVIKERSSLVIKAKEVRIVKEVIRGDGL